MTTINETNDIYVLGVDVPDTEGHVVLTPHADLLKFLVSRNDEHVTMQQIIFGAQVASQLDVEVAISQFDLRSHIDVFDSKTPYYFASRADAEKKCDELTALQDTYYEGILDDLKSNVEKSKISVLSLNDLKAELPEAPAPESN